MTTATPAPPLTAATIMVMPAGPEMDALIAERIYHHEGVRVDLAHPWKCVRTRSNIEGYFDLNLNGSLMFAEYPVDNYSTQIGAAWRVLEHVGRMVVVDCRHDDSAPAKWCCYREEEDGGTSRDCLGETAPLAICRCALLATLRL